MKFGSSSNTWSIAPADFTLEQLEGSSNQCVGAFFEVDNSGTTAPPWIIGDTFLVRLPPCLHPLQRLTPLQKNVYTVFRSSPGPSVGFAKLSSTALAMNGVRASAPSPTIGSVAAAVTQTTGLQDGTDRSSNAAAAVYRNAHVGTLCASALSFVVFALW